MAKAQEYTVRCWAADASCPGGYRPAASLKPEALEAFRKRNAERMARAIQDHVNAHPEAFATL